MTVYERCKSRRIFFGTDHVFIANESRHNASDGIHLCHTSCSLLDGGTLESYLAKVAAWVTSNPNDGQSHQTPSPLLLMSSVVTLVMVNIDDLPPTAFTSAFTSSGLLNKTYTPSSATTSLYSWPTLGTLIDAGTTVVVFMDAEADFTSVPYIIDEFSNVFEDAYGESEREVWADGRCDEYELELCCESDEWETGFNDDAGEPFLGHGKSQLGG